MLIIILLLWFVRHTIITWCYDIGLKLYQLTEPWKPYVNNNLNDKIETKKMSLCFVTLEDRTHNYINLHNQNILKYIQNQNKKGENYYDYIFSSKCNSQIAHKHNPYWCKFLFFRSILESNKWDYVVCLDSDTIITNYEFDLVKELQKFNSDCFCSIHKQVYKEINAGVVILRNSKIGNQIIKEVTDTYVHDEFFKTRCITKFGDLRGYFGQSCYEQGVLSSILLYKYKDFVTILSPDIIHNTAKGCEAKFIFHKYNSSSKDREECFSKYI